MKNEKVQQLANLIVVRNHLSLLLNGTRNVIKKTDVQSIGNLIQRLDSDIVQESLVLFNKEAAVPVDEDIQKRVAEAKAKMAALKSSPAGAAVKNAVKKAAAPMKASKKAGVVKKISEDSGDDAVNE